MTWYLGDLTTIHTGFSPTNNVFHIYYQLGDQEIHLHEYENFRTQPRKEDDRETIYTDFFSEDNE